MIKSTVLYLSLATTTAASVYLWVQWRGAQEDNRQLYARIERLERRPERPPAPVSIPDGSRAAASATPSPVPQPELPSSAPSPAVTPNYFRDSQRRLLKNPEYRRALLARHRLNIENQYRDLPKYLHLPDDTTGRLFDLMAEHEVERVELQAGWPENRQGDKSLQAMSADLRAQNDAELTQLIGDRNLTQMKEYGSNLESRLEVDALRAELARTSEPLREDQLEPMIALVSAENQRVDQETRDRARAGGTLPPDFNGTDPDLATAANKRIVDAAAMVLSSEQLATVQDFYRRQRIQMETQRDLSRLREEAATRKSN